MAGIRIAPWLLLAVLILTAAGCASTKSQESAGEYIDDSVVTAKVKTAILSEPALKSSEINVETYKGVVQLSGFVSNPEAVGTATMVAKKVRGVRSVHNDLHLKAAQ